MQPTIQVLGGLERRIDLSIPSADVAREVTVRLNRLARDVRLPGFRKGKVPLKMVAASYGAQVQSEVLSDKVGQAFSQAVSAGKLRVAGAPRVEPRSGADAEAAELAFSATFEVYPEISLSAIDNLGVKRVVCPVDDAAIDRTLEIMRKQRATFEAVERPLAESDHATVDFVGKLDGVAFDGGAATDFVVVVGEGRMLPEFEQALRGMKTGESKTFPLTFPADYRATELAGKTAQFEVTVKKVEQPVLPPLDAAFAQSLGVADGDLAKMRAEVKANLEREVTNRLKARTKVSVMEALIGAVSFEVPKGLVAGETERLSEMARNDLVARGINAKEAPLPADVLVPQAERRVRLGLLVGELVRVEKLNAQQQQIRKAIEDIAQSYERPAEVIQWYLSDRNRLAEIENAVLEDNVVGWVLSRAKVTEEPVPFDELMGHPGR
jgi:trigger factor